MAKLTATVHVDGPDGRKGFVRGTDRGDIPSEYVKQITNPSAWDDAEPAQEPEPTEPEVGDEPPPKTGAGSSQANWLAYARSIGLDVDDDTPKGEIIEAVEALEGDGDEDDEPTEPEGDQSDAAA